LISPRVKKNEEIILWQTPDTQQFPHFQRGKPHHGSPVATLLAADGGGRDDAFFHNPQCRNIFLALHSGRA